MTDTVLVSIDGQVATVSLNRPHRYNAWTGRMHAEYKTAMATLDADTSIRAIVVTGSGNTFCVGGDSDALADHADRGGYDPGESVAVSNPGTNLPAEFNHDLAWHYGLRVPVIAAVNGACAGIGLALALFCDLRFVSATAKCTTAAPKIGLPAEYGMSWTLPRIIGVTRATDLLLSGRVFTGEETRDWGLWNGVGSDSDHTQQLAHQWARTLVTTTGPQAVATTKVQIYRDLIRHSVGDSVDESIALINDATSSAEYREGVAALRDKRPPNF
jgi:enoyl-CoA hydratase/carnithine racemase